MTQQDEGLCIVAELETLATNGGGFADPAALLRIEGLVIRLKGYLLTADKPQNVLDWAKVLFSARKHRRYGGPQAVRRFILQDCMSLRKIIEHEPRSS